MRLKKENSEFMLEQVSIFAENKKGAMQKITQVLLQENINIWGSVTNESSEFGIVRMVVSDPDTARKALEAEGYMVKLTDIMGIEVPDHVGALDSVLRAISDSNINVNYIYLSFNRESAMPVMVLHTDDIWEAEESLKMKGYHLL